MQVKVRFHKALQKYTNGVKDHTFDADSYFEVVKNCLNLFPDMERMFKSFISNKNNSEEIVIIVNKKILPLEELLFKPKMDKEIVLCPVLYGGGNAFKIIAVVAIVAIAVMNPELFFTMGAVDSAGLGFAAQGLAATSSLGAISGLTIFGNIMTTIAFNLVTSIFAPTPQVQDLGTNQSSDAGARRNNDAFDGLANSAGTNVPVNLHYGHIRVAGHLISGYIKSVAHNKNDNILIRDFI